MLSSSSRSWSRARPYTAC